MVEALVFSLDKFVNASVAPGWLSDQDTKDFTEKHCEGQRKKQMHPLVETT
jgi:hypothetical protein